MIGFGDAPHAQTAQNCVPNEQPSRPHLVFPHAGLAVRRRAAADLIKRFAAGADAYGGMSGAGGFAASPGSYSGIRSQRTGCAAWRCWISRALASAAGGCLPRGPNRFEGIVV